MIRFQHDDLLLFESALFRTTTTLFYNEDLLLLVDPNWLPGEVAEIRHWVQQLRGTRALYLLFTHSDYDHIIAYPSPIPWWMYRSKPMGSNWSWETPA